MYSVAATYIPHDMKRSLILALTGLCCGLLIRGQDTPGSSDHPLFPRLKGFKLLEYDVREPSTHPFYDETGKEMVISGRMLFYYYESDVDLTPAKILAGFTAIAREKGAKMCAHDETKLCMLFQQDNVEVWADLSAGDFYYTLRIIEKAEINQVVTAEGLHEDLAGKGESVLYLRFSYRGSEIQPYSLPSVDTLAAVLKELGDAPVEIVGHTDSEGSEADNRRISLERAVAVAERLVAAGIDRQRLTCTGLGEGAPAVADTESAQGKALNRRIEIKVKK